MEIAGRTALVTGAGHRLGRAFALGLAEAGADVIVNYNTSAAEAEETARQVEAIGRRAVVVQGDVSRRGDVQRLVETADTHFGRLDILVNSASLFERAAFADIGEDDWDRTMAVNLKGPFMLSQAATPLLKAAGGVIVNIVDLSALQPWPSYAHHSVSKAGLLHLTRILARALGPEIRVNAIAPGTVLPPEGQRAEEGSERRVLERGGQPGDVVQALLYLVQSDFVTGDCLVVDGGRILL